MGTTATRGVGGSSGSEVRKAGTCFVGAARVLSRRGWLAALGRNNTVIRGRCVYVDVVARAMHRPRPRPARLLCHNG